MTKCVLLQFLRHIEGAENTIIVCYIKTTKKFKSPRDGVN